MVPRVTIMEASSVNFVRMMPLINPQSVPHSSAIATAAPIGNPALYETPSSVALSATVEPTERSISPITRMYAIGNAMNPLTRNVLIAVNRFAVLR